MEPTVANDPDWKEHRRAKLAAEAEFGNTLDSLLIAADSYDIDRMMELARALRDLYREANRR